MVNRQGFQRIYLSQPTSRNYPGICMGELRKNMKTSVSRACNQTKISNGYQQITFISMFMTVLEPIKHLLNGKQGLFTWGKMTRV
jgi:hypothetical protein